MNLHTWWLFVATVFVVSAIPGPNMLLVMTHGARHGLRRSTWTMAGCLTALVLMLSVSAAGLGAVLEAWPAMFNTLRFAGAAYLIYLGVKAWRARVDDEQPAADVETVSRQGAPASRGTLFRNGFLVAGSNPKAILFAAALLPQFINAAEPTLPQFGVLVVTFAVIEVSGVRNSCPTRLMKSSWVWLSCRASCSERRSATQAPICAATPLSSTTSWSSCSSGAAA